MAESSGTSGQVSRTVYHCNGEFVSNRKLRELDGMSSALRPR
ncbi:hypothetical protein FOMG_19901 [Fusarium oxysporum f. sp. melonis 26406]|uniref:Uncharacterized protein n=1 Tax=Fusarium oxysporum f. sp. melonis 26406 TaxID=1089452 RepID=W9Z4Y2_FUSOX|nr:hypothetical protein FOMG_19901 [Fusarium oxysporum f. sp. melonis 26406]